jgi:uncharacterized protein YciW
MNIKFQNASRQGIHKILDYAEKLSLSSSKIVEGDIERFRAIGLDDRGILQVNLCAAFFNYINRVANGLGGGRG